MDRQDVSPRGRRRGDTAPGARRAGATFCGGAPLMLSAVLIATVRPSVIGADEIRTLDGRVIPGDARIKRDGVQTDNGDLFPLTRLYDVRRTKTAPVPMGAGVVLVDGSRVAGQIRGVEQRGVTVQPGVGDPLLIPPDRVARVQFTAVDPDRFKSCTDGTTAAVLKDGDLFAGTVQSFDGKNLTMDSAVFGPTTFVIGEKAVAIYFRNAGPLAGDVRVTLADGTRVVAEKIEPDAMNGDYAARMKITARGIGVLTVPVDELVEIARAGPGVVDAAGLRPTALDGGPADWVYAVDRAVDGLSTRIVGTPPDRVICVADGSVTIPVPAGCDFFTARLAVPADVVPSTEVKLSVIVDGTVEATATRSSVDDPATVMVPVAGHGSVRLKAEPDATGPAAGVVGLWCDPVFLKHVDRPKPVTRPTTRP